MELGNNDSSHGTGTPQRRSMLTRRNVVRATAWTVPAISIATAVPAYAGSPVQGATSRLYSQNFANIPTVEFGTGTLAGWALYGKATANTIGDVYLGNKLGTTTNAGAQTATKAATAWSNSGGGFLNYASPTAPLTSASTTTDQANSANRALGLVQTGAPTAGPIFDPGMAVVYDFTGQNGSLANKADVTASVVLTVVSPQTRSTKWTLQYGTSDTAWVALDSYTTTATGTAFGDGKTLMGILPNELVGSAKIRVVALDATTGTGSRDGITLDNFMVAWVE